MQQSAWESQLMQLMWILSLVRYGCNKSDETLIYRSVFGSEGGIIGSNAGAQP